MRGSVFELGCFDARSLDYLSFTPSRYLGVDAGWEGGLDAAIARYPQFEFRRTQHLFQPLEAFDLAISLETLEHLPRPELPSYVEMLANTAPVLLATVPVEIGPIFASKYVAKLALGSNERYRVSEAFFSSLGMTSRVEQVQHKGFDYRSLVQLLNARYKRVRHRGLPIAFAPLASFTVAIRAEN